MIKALNQLSVEIEQYKSIEDLSANGHALNKHLQQINGLLFYLESERNNYKEKWEKIRHDLIKSGSSVASADNTASVQVPELYKLRNIIRAGWEVAGAIRTNISFIKSER